MAGLFGYLLKRSAAAALLRDTKVYPFRRQVDVALNARPWPKGARFALHPAVLLTSPKSEVGACDTDVQTLGSPDREAHRLLPKSMMRM